MDLGGKKFMAQVMERALYPNKIETAIWRMRMQTCCTSCLKEGPPLGPRTLRPFGPRDRDPWQPLGPGPMDQAFAISAPYPASQQF